MKECIIIFIVGTLVGMVVGQTIPQQDCAHCSKMNSWTCAMSLQHPFSLVVGQFSAKSGKLQDGDVVGGSIVGEDDGKADGEVDGEDVVGNDVGDD